jgi:hypothetical protein
MWRAFNANGTGARDIYLNTSTWINGYPTHNARFSVNSPLFMTVNGPFDAGAKDANTIMNGSANVEITLGKLDAGLTTISGWARVTNNTAADYMANAWIDPGTVVGTPRIGLSIDTLKFTAVKNSANPDSQSVQVNNIGGGTLANVTATESAAWLTVNRRGSGNSQQLGNLVNITGLDSGSQVTRVVVSGGGAANSDTYYVSLRINLAARQISSIDMSPDTIAIGQNAKVTITGYLYDQYGAAFAAPVTWTVSGGGSMNPTSSDRKSVV